MQMYGHKADDKITIDTSKVIHKIEELPSGYIKRGFEAAMKASKESEWYSVRDRMGSAIFAGSRLISLGSNFLAKSKPGNTFTKIGPNGKVIQYLKSIHCEQQALVRIRHYDYSNQKLVMFVYREDAKGNMAASFPCPMCQNALRKSDVDVVYFITHDHYLGVWRL